MAEQKDNRKVVIELQNVKRYFQVGSETVKALRGVSFKIYEGEFVTIMGTSGSGKSTLLNQLGCLDTPTSGEYFLDGVSVRSMSKIQRAHLRNQKIGFVFQNYNLLPKTTAVENVELPLMYNSRFNAQQRKEAAIKALQAVGLGDRLYHKSNQTERHTYQHDKYGNQLVLFQTLFSTKNRGQLKSDASDCFGLRTRQKYRALGNPSAGVLKGPILFLKFTLCNANLRFFGRNPAISIVPHATFELYFKISNSMYINLKINRIVCAWSYFGRFVQQDIITIYQNVAWSGRPVCRTAKGIIWTVECSS